MKGEQNACVIVPLGITGTVANNVDSVQTWKGRERGGESGGYSGTKGHSTEVFRSPRRPRESVGWCLPVPCNRTAWYNSNVGGADSCMGLLARKTTTDVPFTMVI